jgi:hypothetical protein
VTFDGCVESMTSARLSALRNAFLPKCAGVRGFAAKLAGDVDPRPPTPGKAAGRRANGYSDQPLVTTGAATGYLPTGLLPTGYLPTGYLPTGAGAAGTG